MTCVWNVVAVVVVTVDSVGGPFCRCGLGDGLDIGVRSVEGGSFVCWVSWSVCSDGVCGRFGSFPSDRGRGFPSVLSGQRNRGLPRYLYPKAGDHKSPLFRRLRLASSSREHFLPFVAVKHAGWSETRGKGVRWLLVLFR